ncbi:MAG: trypsin-like peptidase domain-containing protein [Pseudonocardia sp.]|nr:trypsin-like peptidase domain-containing protein [Pseudonocardia sp.]
MTTVDRAIAVAGRAGLFASACVRVRDLGGFVVGSGFLVGPDMVATCAHVVAEAVDGRADSPEPPTGEVTLDFPVLGDAPAARTARIARWSPIDDDGRGDVALLRLSGPAPAGAVMPPLRGGDESRWDHRFRVFGFPEGQDDGVWATGRIRGVQGTGWLQLQGAPGDHPVVGGFSGSPVWDDDSGAVIGMTVAADRLPGVTTAYLIPVADVLGLDPELLPCPYRGAEPFEEEHSEVFFGREPELARLRQALADGPVAAVAGPSGAGKSSLVRAGLLPGMRRGRTPIAEVRADPPERVLESLAAAVLRLTEPGTAPARSAREAARIGGLLSVSASRPAGIDELAAALSGTGPALLVFDQFEELVDAAPDRARVVLDVLAGLVGAGGAEGAAGLRVVLTVRARALEEVLTTRTARLLGAGTVLVGSLDPARLRETVERPAGVAPGLRFADGLVDRILADADPDAGPGQLPLIQELLVQLWHRRDGGTLTWDAYQDAGGVAGALARHADRAAAAVAVGPEPDRELDTLLARLVAVDRDGRAARRGVRYRDLPAPQRALVTPLAAYRLVTVTGQGDDAVVETAHQSLAEHWPRMRRVIDDDRDFLAWRTELDAARQRWLATGRDDDALLRGVALAEAGRRQDRAGELTGEQTDYLDRSRDRRRRELRRRRAGIVALALALVVAAIVSVVAVRSRADADARDAAATLARESDTRAGADPALAAELAATAWRTAPDEPTAHQALARRYGELAGVDGYVAPLDSAGRTEVFSGGSGDAASLLVITEDPGGQLRFSLTGGALGPRPRPHDPPPGRHDNAVLSADGRWAALHRRDGGVELVDLAAPPGTAPVELTGAGRTGSVLFTPDATRLGWVERDPTGASATVRERDLHSGATRTLPLTFGPEPVSVQLLDGPDRALVRVGEDGPARLVTSSTGAVLDGAPPGDSILVSGPTPMVESCGGPASARVLSLRPLGGGATRTIPLWGRSCHDARLSGDGRWSLVDDTLTSGQQRWRATEVTTGRVVQFHTPELDPHAWSDRQADGIALVDTADGPVALVAAGSAVLRVPTAPAHPVGDGQGMLDRFPTEDPPGTVVSADPPDLVSADARTGRELARLPGVLHRGSGWMSGGPDLWTLTGGPDGGWLLRAHRTGTLAEHLRIRPPGGPVGRAGVNAALARLPDGRITGMVALVDGVLSAWDPRTGTQIGEPLPVARTPDDTAWYRENGWVSGRPGHPGQALVSGPGGRLELWDVPGRRMLRELPVRAPSARSVAVDADRVAVASGRQTLGVWDLDTGAEVVDDVPVPALRLLAGFTTDGLLVAASEEVETRILLLDPERRAVTATLPVHTAGSIQVVGRNLLVEGTTGALPQVLSTDPAIWQETVCRALPAEPSPAARAALPDAASREPCG